MGTSDKIQTVLPHPGPHAKCLLGQQESPSRQIYISAQTVPSLPLVAAIPAEGDLAGSRKSQAQSGDTVKGLAWPGPPILKRVGWGMGTWPRSLQGRTGRRTQVS